MEKQPRPYGFQPGISGNPKGRPKLTVERQEVLKALLNLCPKAVEVINECLASEKLKDRQWATEMIFDRTLPKLEEVSKPDESTLPITSDQLSQLIFAVRSGPVETSTVDAPK